ncbi:hypothetical protein AB3K78_09490 [Leucobacter sp. HNU]|uniref:hypothetical protein n=1 Tax=Leucobacter sp. HNU TaxID=3236805 RepID=UPI003A805B1F
MAAVAAAGAVLLVLSGCGRAEPEPKKLTASEAGTQYLSAVCPVNDAWDRADVELDRLRLVAARGSAATQVDPKPFSSAIGVVGTESARAAEQLGSAGIVWPKAAAPAIAEVRDSSPPMPPRPLVWRSSTRPRRSNTGGIRVRRRRAMPAPAPHSG